MVLGAAGVTRELAGLGSQNEATSREGVAVLRGNYYQTGPAHCLSRPPQFTEVGSTSWLVGCEEAPREPAGHWKAGVTSHGHPENRALSFWAPPGWVKRQEQRCEQAGSQMGCPGTGQHQKAE